MTSFKIDTLCYKTKQKKMYKNTIQTKVTEYVFLFGLHLLHVYACLSEVRNNINTTQEIL